MKLEEDVRDESNRIKGSDIRLLAIREPILICGLSKVFKKNKQPFWL